MKCLRLEGHNYSLSYESRCEIHSGEYDFAKTEIGRPWLGISSQNVYTPDHNNSHESLIPPQLYHDYVKTFHQD